MKRLMLALILMVMFGLSACGPAPVDITKSIVNDGTYLLVSSNCVSTPNSITIDVGLINELPDIDSHDPEVVSFNGSGLVSINGENGCVASWQRR